MSSSTVAALAFLMTIVGIHVLNARPALTGLCKQYGHGCLGGHGKRSDNLNSRLINFILRKEPLYLEPGHIMLATNDDDIQERIRESLNKKLKNWDI